MIRSHARRTWMCPLVALLASLALFLGPNRVFGFSSAHPADGPHVDVKIAIDSDAVRMQLTMNIVFLDEAFVFKRELPDRIAASEGPALLDALQAWADAELPALIDGIEVAPIVDDLMMSDPDESRLALFPRTGMRGLRKIRFVVAWPLKSPPQEVQLEWPVYPPDTTIDPDNPPSLQIAAELSAEGMREAVYFTVDSPIWLWRSGATSIEERLERIPEPQPTVPWKLPVFSLLLLVGGLCVGMSLLIPGKIGSALSGLLVMVGCAVSAFFLGGVAVVEITPPGTTPLRLPSTRDAERLFVPMHANMYRAFDYVNESDVYDALERSVEGELLDELYRSIYQSLVLEEEEGALSQVVAVRALELDVSSIGVREDAADGTPRIGFDALFRWQVDGRVAHWGHVHERTNEYLASFGVVGSGQGWRVASVDLLEQERVDEYDDPDGEDGGMPDIDIYDEDFEL